MGDIIRFEPLRAAETRRETKRVAALLIEQLGVQAGYRVGCLACFGGLPRDESARLLAIGDEMERVQGFGWWFGDEPSTPSLDTSGGAA